MSLRQVPGTGSRLGGGLAVELNGSPVCVCLGNIRLFIAAAPALAQPRYHPHPSACRPVVVLQLSNLVQEMKGETLQVSLCFWACCL